MFNSPNQSDWIRQSIKEAGGPTFVSRQLKVSAPTLYDWIRKGRIPNVQKYLELRALHQRVLEAKQ